MSYEPSYYVYMVRNGKPELVSIAICKAFAKDMLRELQKADKNGEIHYFISLTPPLEP